MKPKLFVRISKPICIKTEGFHIKNTVEYTKTFYILKLTKVLIIFHIAKIKFLFKIFRNNI